MAKKRITRDEYLNDIVRKLRQPRHGKVQVEYRAFKGWFMTGDEPRWIGDDGDLMGTNWQDAEYAIRAVLG